MYIMHNAQYYFEMKSFYDLAFKAHVPRPYAPTACKIPLIKFLATCSIIPYTSLTGVDKVFHASSAMCTHGDSRRATIHVNNNSGRIIANQYDYTGCLLLLYLLHFVWNVTLLCQRRRLLGYNE